MARWLLERCFRAAGAEVCVHLVNAKRMTKVNEHFLGHEGSTDVITFDHLAMGTDVESPAPASSNPSRRGARTSNARSSKQGDQGRPPSQAPAWPRRYCGEIFVSVDDAVAQAALFHTTWQQEVARYVIHGLLHLAGHTDLEVEARRRMKRQENRLLRLTTAAFPIHRLGAGRGQSMR
jgi:probable rRNA maturation factor